ncbi:hypothetical protein P3T76_013651 [Phytophthora citrophthora]|uniref:Uncharacterized protein n=1 Tax=Phytophthora citrophthora TaxID=4793 RepID=A0AAD9G2B1_9STRA|nr:hypothetical protein P3T76_013651 [Phytophthora citrophthora]
MKAFISALCRDDRSQSVGDDLHCAGSTLAVSAHGARPHASDSLLQRRQAWSSIDPGEIAIAPGFPT